MSMLIDYSVDFRLAVWVWQKILRMRARWFYCQRFQCKGKFENTN